MEIATILKHPILYFVTQYKAARRSFKKSLRFCGTRMR